MALAKLCLAAAAVLMMVGAAHGFNSKSHLRTYNVDPSFSRWPNKTNILYSLDANYTSAELILIRAGIAQLMSDMKNCIQFVETVVTDINYKIHVSPFDPTGVYQTFCYSYQGRSNAAVNAGAVEQRLILTRGQYGCLDGSLRNIMKYFAIVLGKRNEHQRGDRETYITVNTANVAVANSYRLYNTSEAMWSLFPYDYCSITHNKQTDYAVAGTNAFTVVSDPKAIPALNTLSNTDCQLLSMIYSCPTSSCAALNCTAAREAALSGTTASPVTTVAVTATTAATTVAVTATTAATTVAVTTMTATTVATTAGTTTSASTTVSTTTGSSTSTSATSSTSAIACPTNGYCTNAPDESSYLQGPYQQYQTLLLYSGPCVMEYKFNFDTGKLDPTQAPMLITSYFAAPGGPTASPPLSLNYYEQDATTGALTLSMCSLNSASCLTCISDPSVETNAMTCPNVASTTGAIDPEDVVTSCTSQLNLENFEMYQYVVLKDSNRTEIGLMNSDFSTLYQQSSGFLSGQSTITAITAIQILQDETGINPEMMAVFGIGADGLGYVGYVSMLLTADDTLPIEPYTWIMAPVPIGQEISNYC